MIPALMFNCLIAVPRHDAAGETLIPGRMRGFPSFKSVQHGDANLPIFAPNAARSAHYFRH
jgi:hypothetical protein